VRGSVIVLGSDANALVAAHFIALADHAVTLFQERAVPDDGALDAGWIPPQIIRRLDLDRYGLRVHAADPWAVIPLADGDRLELARDVARTAEAIRKVSPRDAAKWPEFCQRMHALARLLEQVYTAPPPDPLTASASGLSELTRSALRVRRLGASAMEDLFRLLPMSAADWLDEWFETDALKGLLGAAAVMHLRQGPRSGGTAFNLLHHHVGSAAGVFRPALSNVRAALGRRAEVAVRPGSVTRIDVREGRVAGVVLEDGQAVAASAVVCAYTPAHTLLELVDPGLLDPELVRALRNIRSRGVAAEVALTLDREPTFTTLVIAPSLDYIERAYDDVKYGRVSAAPCIEARYVGPSAERDHRFSVQLHAQYVPHALRDGVWDTTQSEKLARTLVSRVCDYVPGLADTVIEQRILTPHDLEHIHGHPQGQPYQAEMALDQVLWMRPVPELARYKTPIEGLYLCGPAMHPGGAIVGAAGANAASIVLRDLKKRKT